MAEINYSHVIRVPRRSKSPATWFFSRVCMLITGNLKAHSHSYFNIHSWLSLWLRLDYRPIWYVRAASEGEKVNTGIYQNPVPKNQVSNRVLIILFLLCVPRQLYRWNPTKIGEVFNSKDHDISLKCPISTIILSWRVLRNVYITTLHTATMIYYCLGKIWYMSPDWKKIVISVVKSTSDDIDTELANGQFNYRICLIHMVRVQQSHSAHQHKSVGRNWKKFLRNLEVCTGVDFFYSISQRTYSWVHCLWCKFWFLMQFMGGYLTSNLVQLTVILLFTLYQHCDTAIGK